MTAAILVERPVGFRGAGGFNVTTASVLNSGATPGTSGSMVLLPDSYSELAHFALVRITTHEHTAVTALRAFSSVALWVVDPGNSYRTRVRFSAGCPLEYYSGAGALASYIDQENCRQFSPTDGSTGQSKYPSRSFLFGMPLDPYNEFGWSQTQAGGTAYQIALGNVDVTVVACWDMPRADNTELTIGHRVLPFSLESDLDVPTSLNTQFSQRYSGANSCAPHILAHTCERSKDVGTAAYDNGTGSHAQPANNAQGSNPSLQFWITPPSGPAKYVGTMFTTLPKTVAPFPASIGTNADPNVWQEWQFFSLHLPNEGASYLVPGPDPQASGLAQGAVSGIVGDTQSSYMRTLPFSGAAFAGVNAFRLPIGYYNGASTTPDVDGVVAFGPQIVGASATGTMYVLGESFGTVPRALSLMFDLFVNANQASPTDAIIDLFVIDPDTTKTRVASPAGTPAAYSSIASWLGHVSWGADPTNATFTGIAGGAPTRETHCLPVMLLPGQSIGFALRTPGAGYAAPVLDGAHVIGRVSHGIGFA